MDWLAAAGLGACGGAIYSLLPPWASLLRAYEARREALRVGKPLPSFREYIDILGDFIVILARTTLGSIAGVVFHTQLTGSATAGAIAVGASAPALLRQLGGIKVVSELVIGQKDDVPSSTDHEPATVNVQKVST